MTIILIVIALLVFALLSEKQPITPKSIGEEGERKTSSQLMLLPENEYSCFDDIIIPSKYGTTQIDHVVVSSYGIFVIETKNFQGHIYGGDRKDEWTQYIYGKKYNFHNPLKQNYGHICALSEYLSTPKEYFVSIVVFSNKAEIKVNTTKHVINLVDLNDTISRYTNEVFSAAEVEKMVLQIRNADAPIKPEERDAHTSQVRRTAEDYQNKKAAGICPRCGGRLVLRSGKYGTFYGCSKYPNCRYTTESY